MPWPRPSSNSSTTWRAPSMRTPPCMTSCVSCSCRITMSLLRKESCRRRICPSRFPRPAWGRPDDAKAVVNRLLSDGEPFLVLADFAAYALAQDQVDALYASEDEWSHKAIVNCLNMGYFSSDRSIREYADRIWAVKPVI